MKKFKNEIQSLIKENNVETALDLLANKIIDLKKLNTVSVLISRLRKLEEDINNGVLTKDNERIERNKINSAILNISNGLDGSHVQIYSENRRGNDTSINQKSTNKGNNEKYNIPFYTGTALLVFMLLTTLFNSDVVNKNFFIYKTVLALSASAFAALTPGLIKIKYKNVISSSGAIGLFIVVFFFTPSPETDTSFTTRVILKTINSSNITDFGKIVMFLGNEPKEETVQENNDALFENIPPQYLGKKAKFGIKFSETYELLNPDSLYELGSNSLIELSIRLKLNNLIRGTILHDDTPLKSVIVSIGESKDTSNNIGRYKIVLSNEELQEEQYVQFSKEGFKTIKQKIYLQSLKELDIVMEKL